MRKQSVGTTLVVAALLGVGSLVTPTSVMAGHAYPARVQAARDYALHKLGHKEYQCLDAIVARESGWNPHAGSPAGYYGLAQTRNPAKMGRGWRDDPMVQTKWMLSRYIPARYGTACKAWAFWRAHGWW